MSFDLGVWYCETAPSVEEAGNLYVSLCEQRLIPTEVHAEVEAFYRELCKRYPEIDSVPEEEVDDCPWACALDKTGFHVIMAMSFGRQLSYVSRFVMDLAAKHGLVCYDPQGPDVYLPPALRPKKAWYQFWRIR